MTDDNSTDGNNEATTNGLTPSEWQPGDAEDYDIDLGDLGTTEKRIWKDQQRFLEQYSCSRTKTSAAKYAGVSRETARLWQKENKLEFGKRLAEADEGFCNMLEGHAVKLALETKAGQNPVLLIALLNANLPDKYRPQSVQIDGKAEETLVTLRKLSRNATIALETEKRRLTGAEETEGSQSSSAIGEAESILRQHTR